MVNRVTDHFSEGFTIELQKRNTLAGSALADGGGSAALKTPNATAGATSLLLTSAVTLSGVLLKGSALTITGDPTAYTVAADAVPSNKSITVSFTPALAQDTTAGLSVSTSNPSPYVFQALAGRLTEEETKEMEIINPRKLYLTTLNTAVQPAYGDIVTDSVGSEPIQKIEPMTPGSDAVGWSIVIGKV
jgi:hypothetical protein